MSLWTLQYYDATQTLQEVSFPALAALEGGIVSDGWMASFQSHKASTVQLHLPGVPPHIAPAIPFESRVTLWSGRTGTGPYSGGTKQFQGLRTDRTSVADPNRPSSSYQFEDEWYFLDHCPFQQMWVQLITSGGASNYVPFSSVVLFQPNPGQTYSPVPVAGIISTGQQIVDVLNWAILQGANLQIGQIDPAAYQAWYPLQNVKCGDAIRHCLRVHPDCFTEIDYTTTPPTFHVRQRSNLTQVNLPYAYTDSSGRRHIASDIQPRPELQPKRVALFYRVVASNMLLSTPCDIYPYQNLLCQGPVLQGQPVGASAPYIANGTPTAGTAMAGITGTGTATIPVGAPGGLRALDFAIDLQGPKISVSQAAITSASFDPTNLTWWKRKVPSLGQSDITSLALLSTTINGGGATNITVVQDGTGSPINLSTYAWELLPQSSPMAWMTSSVGGPLAVVEAVVTAHFSYQKSKTVGSGSVSIASPNDHVHSVRVKLVNSASITQKFSQYITTGEAVPANLAQTVYNALATLQYTFSHTMVEKPFNGWLKPGKHGINLTGALAAAAWATMNATLQSSEYTMHLDGIGNTFDNFSVKCGPVEHLEPGELIQLFNVFSNRDLSKIDTGERLTGNPAPANTIVASNDTAQENSVPAQPDAALMAFTGIDLLNTGALLGIAANPTGATDTMHPAGELLTVAHVNASTGALYTSGGISPTYHGSGAPPTSGLSASAYYRLNDRYIDTSANKEYYCSTAGLGTASGWTLISGASVGMVNYRGVWSGASSYSISDAVSLGSGTSAGFYLSTINSNTNTPDSGIGWVQFASYATWL